MRKTVISEFMSGLDELGKKLIDHYIEHDYVPKVRTGQGRRNNFFYEHNSHKGVEIVREILKFKKMQLGSGYLSITLNSKRGEKKKINNNKKKR